MSNRVKGLDFQSGDWAVTQEIDLADYVDAVPSDSYKQAFAQRAIETIVNRTRSGKAPNGRSFEDYSTAYSLSNAYRAAGKTSRVNLTLTGEMLDTITELQGEGSKVLLGWGDSLNNAKAHGHMTGKDGSGDLPVREFFGVTENEIREIVRDLGQPTGPVVNAEDTVLLEDLFRSVSIFRGLFR
jgi:hypothetical protein